MVTGNPNTRSSERLKVGIVDYGMGNVHSVGAVIELFGHEAILSSDLKELSECDRLILPGVGSFFRAVTNIRSRGLHETLPRLTAQGIPLLGICLGMQLLATAGTEDGDAQGLGLIPGTVRRLPTQELPVPHVGFGTVKFTKKAQPFNARLGEASDFYFVHSFRFEVEDPDHVAGVGAYDGEFVAIVRNGNILGTQFHPEKSQSNGLKFLQMFFSGNR